MRVQTQKYLVVAILSFFLGGVFFVSQQANPGSSTANIATANAASTASLDVADVVKNVGPAVVNIEVQISSSSSPNNLRYFPWSRSKQDEAASGTGFIIKSNGYILTNQHVINGASSIKVKVLGQDNAFNATVVGEDYDLDLAILKINANNLPIISMGNSDSMRSGDGVIAIGNPLGLDHTVTTGVISAKGRPVTIEDRNYKNLIQTDAAINPGNSGGPLINMQGQVIAINTAISTEAQGIGFAIPINTAKSIIDDLMTSGKVIRPYLGISMTDISSELAEQMQFSADTKGVLISQVLANSPASHAGVKDNDLLVSIDSESVTSASDVQECIQKQEVGQKVKLGILRNSKLVYITVTLAEKG